MQDGRSQPPALPKEFKWIDLAARINRALNTDYRPEELEVMSSDKVDLLEIWMAVVD